MKIGNHEIGPGQPVFIVAELSGNHGGSFQRAVDLVYAAHKAGADAVKTQCFAPDTITLDSDRPEFHLTWNGQERTLYDLYSETAMPMEWHSELKALCESLGMEYFASVFSPQDTDYMESLGVCAYKIASFELNDLPLIGYVASKGKPVILSTGMATHDEVEAACLEVRGQGVPFVVLLCSSSYPAPTLPLHRLGGGWFSKTIDSVPGISDHTLSLVLPAITAQKGYLIEKHLCLTRADGGPDSSFSLEPLEFQAMVKGVREAERAFDTNETLDQENRRYRRSLFAVQDIAVGERITHGNVRSIRPGDGLPPDAGVWFKRAKAAIPRGTPLRWALLY